MYGETTFASHVEKPAKRLDPFWTRQWIIATALVLFDITSWMVIFATLISIRGSQNTTQLAWWSAGAVSLLSNLGAFSVIGGYNPRTDMRSLTFAAEYILALIGAAAVSFVLIYASASYTQSIKPSRAVLLATFVLAPALGLSWRRFLAGLTDAQNKAREFLVIGGGALAQSFYRTYRASKLTQELRFVSDSAAPAIDGEGSPAVQGDPLLFIKDLNFRVAGIIIAEEARQISPALTEELVRIHFERVPVYTLESFYESFWQKVPVMALDGIWPLQKGFPLSMETPYTSIKRLFDILLTSFGLIVLSPVFAAVALVVKLESRGPVIFSQERIGWHRHPFRVFKFRTMYQREEEGSIYTEANDRRITRSGRWLRKMRLDELPQLWNVLIGDMSLIGPRAEWIKCVALYQDYIPSYHFRHLVRPGITGWAQVNYPYGANLEDAIQKLKYDLYYIRHYSLKLDAMIILKTIHVVFLAKGT